MSEVPPPEISKVAVDDVRPPISSSSSPPTTSRATGANNDGLSSPSLNGIIGSEEVKEKEAKKDVKGKRKQIQERHKMVAAGCGAVFTSMTMTPFDVIKTRLQTQPAPPSALTQEPLFLPSSRLPPPVATVGSNSGINGSSSSTTTAESSSSSKFGSTSSSSDPSSSRRPYVTSTSSTSSSSNAASSSSRQQPSGSATCCQRTFFSTNLSDSKSLLCRFDPRIYPHHSSTSSIDNGYHLMKNSIAYSISTLSSRNSVAAGEACVYPNPSIASSSLPSAQAAEHMSGIIDATSKIIKTDGVKALWRGAGMGMMISVPSQVGYMMGYDWLRSTAVGNAPEWAWKEGVRKNDERVTWREQMGERWEDDHSSSPSSILRSSSSSSTSLPPLTASDLNPLYAGLVPLITGAFARSAVATIFSPLELLRTRLQYLPPKDHSLGSIIKTLRSHPESPSGGGLWRGLPATLWRDVPFSGIYWACYEGLKIGMTGKGMGEAMVINSGNYAGNGKEEEGWMETFGTSFICGGVSGMVAATLTNPFDVIKTRRQALDHTHSPSIPVSSSSSSSSPTTFRLVSEIVKNEGWRGLMKGLSPRLAKVGPACAIMIGAYEGLGGMLAEWEG